MSRKISQLSEITTVADTDILPVVSGNETKKVTKQNLLKEIYEALANNANPIDLDTLVKVVDKATQTDAETGTDNAKWMTPLATKQAIDKWKPKVTKTVTLGGSGDYVCDPANPEIALNLAITELNAAGGGQLDIGPGLFNFQADVLMENLTNPIVLNGVGDATHFKFTVAGTELRITEASRWQIRNMKVDSMSKTSGSSFEHTIRINGAEGWRIINVSIEAYAFGIFTGSSAGGRVTENWIIEDCNIRGACRNDLIGGGPFDDTAVDTKNGLVKDCFIKQDATISGHGAYYTAMDMVAMKGISFENVHAWGNVMMGSERDPHQDSGFRKLWVYPIPGTTDLPVMIKIDDSINTGDQSSYLDVLDCFVEGGWIRIIGTAAHHIKNIRASRNTVRSNPALTSQLAGQILQRGISCTYVDESQFNDNMFVANGSTETAMFFADCLNNAGNDNVINGYPTGIEVSGTSTGNDFGPQTFIGVTNKYGSNLKALLGTSGARMATWAEQTREVEANTAVAASPNVIGAYTENNKLFTNEGVTAKNYHTLPSAVAGLRATFYCQDADGIRVTAASGDTIRIAASVSAAAGFAETATIGNSLTLEAINATEWVATGVVGTWTVT